jgi:hypothetical protein
LSAIDQECTDINNIEISDRITASKIKDDHNKLVLEAGSIIRRINGPFTSSLPSDASPILAILIKATVLTIITG